MKILLFGSTGQVGTELIPLLKKIGNLSALARDDIDLGNANSVHCVLNKYGPDIIVNAAAYTSVEKAENERQQAFSINVSAPEFMAKWAHINDARLIHFSSDYVYDGTGKMFRKEDEGLGPLNTYGESKLAGDDAIVTTNAKAIILRSSWVYSGIRNGFLSTIIERARSGEILKVVNDQVGTPTSAAWLAKTTLKVLQKWLGTTDELRTTPTRVFHAIPSGCTTWMGFATALLEEARRHELTIGSSSVIGIATADWPTAAQRPKNSRLSTDALREAFGIHGPNWRTLVSAEVKKYVSINQNRVC